MAPLVQLLDRNGVLLLDVSSMVRVADSDGLDPYPAFEDPGFNDAPLGEGQPLLNVDEKNREQAFPLWVKGTSKDNLHSVLASLGRACQNCARLAWQDDGATQVSYLDVTYARFDAAYRYFPARKFWFAGTLRIFAAPPFAHTATERIVATNVNSAGLSPVAIATIPAGSIAGDVSALLKARVDTSGAVPGPLGRVVGLAALPTGYTPFIPAASMFSLNPRATLAGASGAPGSQVIAPATIGLASTAQMARFALAASPYAGANRLLGVVRPARVNGLALTAVDDFGNVLGPTALAQGIDGMQLVDLGIANVGTQQPTQTFTIGGGPPVQLVDDSLLQRLVGADRAWGQLAGVIVMPENQLTLALDPGVRVGGRWLAGSGVASQFVSVDDYGNSYPTVLSPITASGYFGNSNALRFGLPMSLAGFRKRSVFFVGNASAQLAMRMSDDTLTGYIDAIVQSAGATAGALYMSADGVGLASLSLASHAQASVLIVDLVRSGDSAYVNVRPVGATSITINPAGGPTTVPVACVGIATSLIRGFAPRYSVDSIGGGSAMLLGHWVDQLQGQPVASDTYTLDGANGISYRTPAAVGSAVLPMSDKLRGAPLRLDPQAAAIAVIEAQRDGGPMNDPLGVEIRVRERFRYAR